jgi:hypothetical protein
MSPKALEQKIAEMRRQIAELKAEVHGPMLRTKTQAAERYLFPVFCFDFGPINIGE